MHYVPIQYSGKNECKTSKYNVQGRVNALLPYAMFRVESGSRRRYGERKVLTFIHYRPDDQSHRQSKGLHCRAAQITQLALDSYDNAWGRARYVIHE